MEILYSCVKDGIVCSIVKDRGFYFCNIGEEKNQLAQSFTTEEKSLEFLLDCIVGAYYKKYISKKELEAINFD